MRSRDSSWFSGVSRALIVLLLVSCAGKIALRLAIAHDSDYWRSGYSFYHRMAVNYLKTGRLFFGSNESGEGGYFCYRAPAYPLLVAGVSSATNDSATVFIVCEALLSTFTVGLVFWVTRRLTGPREALLSASIYAFYPYAFYHDTQLQESVLYNALSMSGVALLVRAVDGRTGMRWFLFAGLATGAAMLTRLSHTASGLALLVVIGISTATTARSRCIAAFTLGMAVMIFPWVVRNKLVTDHFVLTSESGFALARAHNDQTFEYFPYRASIDRAWSEYHQAMPEAKRQQLAALPMDEFARGDWYREEALGHIRAHPFETLWQGLYKVAVNFLGVLSPLQGTVKNWTYTLSYWAVTLLAFVGLAKLRGTVFFMALCGMVLAQCAVSFVFYAHTSHRSFLDPLFAVPAGIGLAKLLDRVREHRAGRAGSAIG